MLMTNCNLSNIISVFFVIIILSDVHSKCKKHSINTGFQYSQIRYNVKLQYKERADNTKWGQVYVQVDIWAVQGLQQHVTLTQGLRPFLGWD